MSVIKQRRHQILMSSKYYFQINKIEGLASLKPEAHRYFKYELHSHSIVSGRRIKAIRWNFSEAEFLIKPRRPLRETGGRQNPFVNTRFIISFILLPTYFCCEIFSLVLSELVASFLMTQYRDLKYLTSVYSKCKTAGFFFLQKLDFFKNNFECIFWHIPMISLKILVIIYNHREKKNTAWKQDHLFNSQILYFP